MRAVSGERRRRRRRRSPRGSAPAETRAVVDVDVLAVGGVHQLVAALDMAGAGRQRLQDEEFGDGELNVLSLPGAEMARRVEHELAALAHRLAVRDT